MDTREVRIGNRVIGGGSPVLIQSMTNTKTEDVQATVAQIKRLTAAGCEIIPVCSAYDGGGKGVRRDQASD